MEKQPLFVAFSTQKGGVGKTAFTVLLSSYLHYFNGKNIAIVDCDFPQHSIMEMRKRDQELVMNDIYYKRMAHAQFKEMGKKVYPVIGSNPEEAIDDALRLIEESKEPIDIVFFDLPGTMNNQGVIRTIKAMDYIFSPISADRLVLSSTLSFASALNENLISIGKSSIKGMYLFWTMVDGRERTPLYVAYNDAIGELGLSLLETTIPDTKRFRREMDETHRAIFRSTIFPPDKFLLKGSNVEELVSEICRIIEIE